MKKGSVFGGVLLIAGCCIGAGMLGLPILTGLVGFFPALVLFAIAWGFMTTTGLYLVEVNSWYQDNVNYISMVKRTLGTVGKLVCWVSYLLLFYSLLVAYIAVSGEHLSSILDLFTGVNLPTVVASVFFVLVFGWLVLMGTRSVDICNRWLMLAKISAFVVLVAIGVFYITPKNLTYSDPKYSFFALPILIISFGFHNMIPTLTQYLGNDTKRVRKSIIYGSLLTFGIYLIWEVIALGILPVKGEAGIWSSFENGQDAAYAIHQYVNSPILGVSAKLLALFAILTSFLANALGLAHFLGDGMKVKNRDSVGLVVLALLPPLLFEILYPNIFFSAINFAGGFCAVILFGILPALMIWKGRYIQNSKEKEQVSGGKPIVILIGIFASLVVLYQLSSMMGLNILPNPQESVL